MHLQKFQDISTQSIYNDLHGYIRHESFELFKAKQFYPLFLRTSRRNVRRKTSSAEEQKDLLERAISKYTEAIQYSPYDATTYVKQGQLLRTNAQIRPCD